MTLKVVVITHEGGPQDFESVLQSLADLHLELDVRVVCDQPNTPSFRFGLLIAAFVNFLSDARVLLRISKHKPIQSQIRSLALFLMISTAQFLLKPGRTAVTKWRERVLFDKHLTALRQACEGQSEYTLVLESDATKIPKTKQLLRLCLKAINAKGSAPIAVFLAEGFSFEALEVVTAEEIYSNSSGESLIRSIPSTSNTTCAYLVSRDTAQRLLVFFEEAASVGCADWNLTFAMQELGIDSYHSVPPAIGHGSRSRGESSIRTR